MSFLLYFVKETETTGSESSSEFTDAQRENSSRGSASRDDCCCAGDACWAHIFSSEGLVGRHSSERHLDQRSPQHARVSSCFLYSSWRFHQRPVSLRPF